MLLCESFLAKMTAAEDYVWFLPEWVASSEFVRCPNASICTKDDIESALDHQLFLSHQYYAKDNQAVNILPHNQTVKQWKQQIPRSNLSDFDFDMPLYLGFVYDSIWLYAYALKDCLQRDNSTFLNITTTDYDKMFCLAKAMRNTYFEGLTGSVRFAPKSSRVLANKVLRQWVNGTWYDLFTFRANNRFEYDFQQGTHQVQWANGSKPDDGYVDIYLHSITACVACRCMALLIIGIGYGCKKYRGRSRSDKEKLNLVS